MRNDATSKNYLNYKVSRDARTQHWCKFQGSRHAFESGGSSKKLGVIKVFGFNPFSLKGNFLQCAAKNYPEIHGSMAGQTHDRGGGGVQMEIFQTMAPLHGPPKTPITLDPPNFLSGGAMPGPPRGAALVCNRSRAQQKESHLDSHV